MISANTPAPRTALTSPIANPDDAPSETVETTTPSTSPPRRRLTIRLERAVDEDDSGGVRVREGPRGGVDARGRGGIRGDGLGGEERGEVGEPVVLDPAVGHASARAIRSRASGAPRRPRRTRTSPGIPRSNRPRPSRRRRRRPRWPPRRSRSWARASRGRLATLREPSLSERRTSQPPPRRMRATRSRGRSTCSWATGL